MSCKAIENMNRLWASTRDEKKISRLQHTLVSLCLHKLRKLLQVGAVDVQDFRFITWWDKFNSNQTLSFIISMCYFHHSVASTGKHELAWQVEVQCILGAVQDHPLGARYLRQKVVHHLQERKVNRGVITPQDNFKFKKLILSCTPLKWKAERPHRSVSTTADHKSWCGTHWRKTAREQRTVECGNPQQGQETVCWDRQVPVKESKAAMKSFGRKTTASVFSFMVPFCTLRTSSPSERR